MASFISGLSLFIFVLINGCFTLPISEIQFPDFTATSFYDGLTTENSFNVRAVTDNEIFTTPFNHIKRSENEDIFSQTETYPTGSTDAKRTVSEAYNFGTATVGVQYESVSDASQQERTSEESSTFSETTERTSEQKRTVEEPSTLSETTEQTSEQKRTVEEPSTFSETTERTSEQKRTVEEPITFTDVPTTENLNTIPHEHKTQHNKRVFLEQDVNSGMNKRLDNSEIDSQFTTSFMPLFTSTSSAVAPELYIAESTEFSSLQTSTRKYVGSLVDPEEHNEEDVEDSKKDSKKYEKEEKKDDEEHREEEDQHNEKDADSDRKTDRENKRVKSSKKGSVDSSADDKYLFGVLFDQESLNNRPTLPSNLAILDESVVPVTAELVRSSTKRTKTTTTTEASDETNKLNQGEESS